MDPATSATRQLRPGSIKICGLREPAHAATAAQAGADMIGFIFAPSRRYVSPEAAQEAVNVARDAAPSILAVGVFVNESAEHMNAVADLAGLDVIQLSGDESPDIALALNRPFLRAFRLPNGSSVTAIGERVTPWAPCAPLAYMLDGYHADHYGGTGVRADWSLATEFARAAPLLLAGGLSPDVVENAVRTVRPLGVDVSSGVEIDGQKDHAAIVAFIQRAKSAFASIVG